MSLIKSISGIRGTIGGIPGDNLTPIDIVKFCAAYGKWLKEKQQGKKVIIGRDGRISGNIVKQLAINTLLSMGIDVVDADLSTTPTIEMAVIWEKADGGIIITASHNPKEWNALKLLNNKGEFISAADGQYILHEAGKEAFEFEPVDTLGKYSTNNHFVEQHIKAVTNYKWVNAAAIKRRKFIVVADVINSTGAISVTPLLHALGVENIIVINENITGEFAHNPEPLPENLTQLSAAVIEHKADLGIAVDPDVDRLCFVNEDGTMFGEEYTLVAVADYMLGKVKGNTVSNLSSTRALKDVTQKLGGNYFASAVGEVNVVEKMKAAGAIIGGEGNGGIIVPDFHYGRDALIGIGLFLTALAESNKTISAFRKQYPDYIMVKNKMNLPVGLVVQDLFKNVISHFEEVQCNTDDGLKIEFENGWVHLRTSNTEPIIRIYAEAATEEIANDLLANVTQYL
ncbi:MAG: phosphoglucosamine mutase [Bacteroidota bacterium]